MSVLIELSVEFCVTAELNVVDRAVTECNYFQWVLCQWERYRLERHKTFNERDNTVSQILCILLVRLHLYLSLQTCASGGCTTWSMFITYTGNSQIEYLLTEYWHFTYWMIFAGDPLTWMCLSMHRFVYYILYLQAICQFTCYLFISIDVYTTWQWHLRDFFIY